MKIQTLSLVTGSTACNAHCPFCISRMTPSYDVVGTFPDVNWARLDKTFLFAKMKGVTTVLITGKGEPTLWPDRVSNYVERSDSFPFVELQTNGLKLDSILLNRWRNSGLTTVALSVVGVHRNQNEAIYTPGRGYPVLADTIRMIHDAGLSVRLTVTMIQGYVDSPESVREVIDYARRHSVEQLTLRPVQAPGNSKDEEARLWVLAHGRIDKDAIKTWLVSNAHHLMTLPHGAMIFDMAGQNVCLSDCLTPVRGEDVRQIIFLPDGHLRYDWSYPGAILM